MSSVSRGVRNCNPLNLRKGTKWQGLSPVQSDPSFCQFRDLYYGLRASIVCLRTYMRRRGCNTVAKIVRRWAPPVENNTSSYISFVSREMRVSQDEKLTFSHDVVFSLVRAMAMYESGFVVLPATFDRAWALL